MYSWIERIGETSKPQRILWLCIQHALCVDCVPVSSSMARRKEEIELIRIGCSTAYKIWIAVCHSRDGSVKEEKWVRNWVSGCRILLWQRSTLTDYVLVELHLSDTRFIPNRSLMALRLSTINYKSLSPLTHLLELRPWNSSDVYSRS